MQSEKGICYHFNIVFYIHIHNQNVHILLQLPIGYIMVMSYIRLLCSVSNISLLHAGKRQLPRQKIISVIGEAGGVKELMV